MRKSGRLWIPETPHLWTRRLRFRVDRIVNPPIRIEGIFNKIELVHARTGKVVRRLGPFKNLILNQGMNLVNTTTSFIFNPVSGVSASVFNSCRVGTGSTPPDVTDTTLESQVGITNDNGGFSESSGLISGNVYWFGRATRVFGTAQANGNLTEVGFGTNTTVFNRQLIVDALGDPTTLVKTSDFQLRVEFEIRIYLPLGDTLGSLEVDGSPVDYISRVTAFGNWNTTNGFGAQLTATGGSGVGIYTGATFNPEGQIPTGGTRVARDGQSVGGYVSNSFKFECVSIWGASIANGVDTYDILESTTTRRMKFQLDTAPAAKTSSDRYVLEHEFSWARA